MTIKTYAREQISIKTETIDFDEFENKTLSEFIDHFNSLRESYKHEFPDNEPIIKISHYGYDGYYEFVLNVYKDESDESYNTRVAKLEYAAKMAEDKILEKERKMYELLRKKFENIG